jgi:very-long-chain (3R)-3-hydroxyacyl-CoA dehydratase
MSNAHVPAVSPLLKVYLVAYNIFSVLGWAYVLGLTLTHLFNLDGNADAVQTHSTSVLSRFMSSLLSLPKVLRSTPTTVESRLPSFLQPIYHRSTSTYLRVGTQTAIVQTFAVLEVVHVLLGWVRSPLQTTVMQVSSRLFLVWGIADQFPEVSSSFDAP